MLVTGNHSRRIKYCLGNQIHHCCRHSWILMFLQKDHLSRHLIHQRQIQKATCREEPTLLVTMGWTQLLKRCRLCRGLKVTRPVTPLSFPIEEHNLAIQQHLSWQCMNLPYKTSMAVQPVLIYKRSASRSTEHNSYTQAGELGKCRSKAFT